MSWNTKDTIRWKRVGPGSYHLMAWYIWKEPEIHAEIIKEKSKWKYRLWTWGSDNPQPQEFSRECFKTAKEVKKRAVERVLLGEPFSQHQRF